MVATYPTASDSDSTKVNLSEGSKRRSSRCSWGYPRGCQSCHHGFFSILANEHSNFGLQLWSVFWIRRSFRNTPRSCGDAVMLGSCVCTASQVPLLALYHAFQKGFGADSSAALRMRLAELPCAMVFRSHRHSVVLPIQWPPF